MSLSAIPRQGIKDHSEIVNACLTAIDRRQATPESCAVRFKDVDDLGSMLALATMLQQLPPVTMPEDSKAALKDRLRATVAQQRTRYEKQPAKPVPTRQPRLSFWMRPLAALLLVVILLASGTGTLLHAAAATVPGDSLYGIKRAAEQVQLTFTKGTDRADLLQTFAENRLNELNTLTTRGAALSDAVVQDTSTAVQTAFTTQTNEGKRVALSQLTLHVLDTARQAGKLSIDAEKHVLLTVNPLLVNEMAGGPSDNTADQNPGARGTDTVADPSTNNANGKNDNAANNAPDSATVVKGLPDPTKSDSASDNANNAGSNSDATPGKGKGNNSNALGSMGDNTGSNNANANSGSNSGNSSGNSGSQGGKGKP